MTFFQSRGRFAPLTSYALIPALAISIVWAQEVSVTQIPGNPTVDDQMWYDVSVGTVDNPVADALELEVVFGYSNYELAATSQLAIGPSSSSWFDDDGKVEYTFSLDSTNREFTVLMVRTDNQARSGFGPVASGGGAVVTIVDMGKTTPDLVYLKYVRMKGRDGTALRQGYDGTLVGYTSQPSTISIHTLSGGKVLSRVVGEGSFTWSPAALSPGLYLVRLNGSTFKYLVPANR